VLVPRLLRLPEGQQALPAHPASYEFLFDLRGDGEKADLPSASVGDADDGREAVVRALAGIGICTWPSCVETLYRGHTYRGGISEVYLVTTYGDVPGAAKNTALAWRAWPVTDHVADAQVGYYSALEHVLPLRLGRKSDDGRGTAELSTYLRRGAVEYVAMQLALVADPSTDTSMSEYLRQSMSPAEKAACKAIVGSAKISAERVAAEAALAAEKAEVGELGADQLPDDGELPVEVPGEDDGTIEDAFGTDPE